MLHFHHSSLVSVQFADRFAMRFLRLPKIYHARLRLSIPICSDSPKYVFAAGKHSGFQHPPYNWVAGKTVSTRSTFITIARQRTRKASVLVSFRSIKNDGAKGPTRCLGMCTCIAEMKCQKCDNATPTANAQAL